MLALTSQCDVGFDVGTMMSASTGGVGGEALPKFSPITTLSFFKKNNALGHKSMAGDAYVFARANTTALVKSENCFYTLHGRPLSYTYTLCTAISQIVRCSITDC